MIVVELSLPLSIVLPLFGSPADVLPPPNAQLASGHSITVPSPQSMTTLPPGGFSRTVGKVQFVCPEFSPDPLQAARRTSASSSRM